MSMARFRIDITYLKNKPCEMCMFLEWSTGEGVNSYLGVFQGGYRNRNFGFSGKCAVFLMTVAKYRLKADNRVQQHASP